MIPVILSTTKDLAKPGNGLRWAQILRPGLRMTIQTPRFLSSPPVVSGDPSEWGEK
jgi:hypothetical protein